MSLKKKPWNRVDHAVYSLASYSKGRHNMNICTYAVPVSMKPKRFVVAIYHNTYTLQLIEENQEFLLQYLSQSQANLVTLLGKKSGLKVDKMKKLAKQTSTYQSFLYLTDARAYVHLKVIDWIQGGDHLCALCDVIGYKNLMDSPPLTLDYLRKKKIIVA